MRLRPVRNAWNTPAINPCCDGRHGVQRSPRKPGEAKAGSEEKVLSPDPGNRARFRAPTRSTPRCWQKCCGPAGLGKASGTGPPWAEARSKRSARPPRSTHATHQARLVTAEPCWRAASRTMFGAPPASFVGYCAAASAIDKASRAPSSSAQQHIVNHTPTASALPVANPAAACRYSSARRNQ